MMLGRTELFAIESFVAEFSSAVLRLDFSWLDFVVWQFAKVGIPQTSEKKTKTLEMKSLEKFMHHNR